VDATISGSEGGCHTKRDKMDSHVRKEGKDWVTLKGEHRLEEDCGRKVSLGMDLR